MELCKHLLAFGSLAGLLAITGAITGCQSQSFTNLGEGDRQSMMRAHLASLSDHSSSSAEVAMLAPRTEIDYSNHASYAGGSTSWAGPHASLSSHSSHSSDSAASYATEADLAGLRTAKTYPASGPLPMRAPAKATIQAPPVRVAAPFAPSASLAPSVQATEMVSLTEGGQLKSSSIGPSDLAANMEVGVTYEGGEEMMVSDKMLAQAMPEQFGGLEYYEGGYVEGPNASVAHAHAPMSMPPTRSQPILPPPPAPTPELPAAVSGPAAPVSSAAMAAEYAQAISQPPPAYNGAMVDEGIVEGTEFEVGIHAAEEHFAEESEFLGGYPVDMTPSEFSTNPSSELLSASASVSADPGTQFVEGAPMAETVPWSEAVATESVGSGTAYAELGNGLIGEVISTSPAAAHRYVDGVRLAQTIPADSSVDGETSSWSPAVVEPVADVAPPVSSGLTDPVPYTPKNFTEALTGIERSLDDSSFLQDSQKANSVAHVGAPTVLSPFGEFEGVEKSATLDISASSDLPPNNPGECHAQVLKPNSGGEMVWKRILCANELDTEMTARLQTALLGAGYFSGKIDGSMSEETQTAVREYQKAKSLAAGEITFETLQALGLK